MASTLPTEAELEEIRKRKAGNGATIPDHIARKMVHDLALERGFGLTGAQFLLDTEHTVEPVWGTERRCLWSRGEPFYMFASPGVGKSTVVQRLVLARAGIREPEVLGIPLEVDTRKILYVAADRPSQIARSWRRMIGENDREPLKLALTVWPKPVPFTISANPEKLLPWVRGFGEIGTVVIDSMFNVAPSLSDEEGAANANNAFQSLVAEGIDVVALHHDRKRDAQARKKVSLDDMYGGRPISGGAGAIVYLDGEPNTGEFEMRWLKAPAGPVDEVRAYINFRTGDVREDRGW